MKWFYGPNDALEIDFQSGRWHDSEMKKGGSIAGIGDAGKAARPDRGIRLDKGTGTSPVTRSNDG